VRSIIVSKLSKNHLTSKHLCRRTHGWDSYATPLMLISVEGDSGLLQNEYP